MSDWQGPDPFYVGIGCGFVLALLLLALVAVVSRVVL